MKNRKIYAICKILKGRKDDELLDVICMTKNVYPIVIHDKGNNNSKKIIYYINRKTRDEGFFAILRTTLYYLEFADRFGMVPYIEWTSDCLYYQKNGYEGRKDPYEYYFKQPSSLDSKDILSSRNIVFAKPNDTRVLTNFPLSSPYFYSEEFISKLASLMEKYILLQDSVLLRLMEDIHALLGEEKVLGIHYRGTDFKKNYDKHPILLTVSDYFKSIEEAVVTYGYKKIFIATDDKNALSEFVDRYKDMIIYYPDVLRAEGTVSVMYSVAERENDNFLKGYEVLRDAYTLANSAGIITGISMVSIFARVFRKINCMSFETDIFIDQGINSNRKKWVTMR